MKRVVALKEWRRLNPVKTRAHRRKQRFLANYGLSLEVLEQMYNQQNRSCAICHDAMVLGGKGGAKVDHEHATGRVRGILCSRCNVALGSFRDNPFILAAAIVYLSPPVHEDTAKISG
jgi:hypothetical protein